MVQSPFCSSCNGGPPVLRISTTSPAVADNAVFFGTGSPQQGAGDGVYAFTPLAVAPTALAGGSG
jgi:hypothetical protein